MPQLAVLEQADAFVTHAGMGGTQWTADGPEGWPGIPGREFRHRAVSSTPPILYALRVSQAWMSLAPWVQLACLGQGPRRSTGS
ncbi:hypothetical protein D7V93_08560 [Corallococcus llansteffanensis]|uniref:Uncharacterized protein n=1 Tax=Corallococcus llansteffanensis TaxID=2316731 RepID=A0A3A8Q4K7_9BACT|nr:hypothetical protein D7V93_08560 [Corallococcus llansteffanensis]